MKIQFRKYCVFYIFFLFSVSGCYFIPGFSGRIIKESDEKLVLKIPGKKWKLVFEYEGVNYISPYEHTYDHGEFANVMAVIEPNWTFTFKFGRQDRLNNIDDELDRFRILNGNRLKIDSMQYLPGIPAKVYASESSLNNVNPLDINQLSKYLVFFYDGVGVDVKISKFRYTPEDEETYKKLVNSIKIIED